MKKLAYITILLVFQTSFLCSQSSNEIKFTNDNALSDRYGSPFTDSAIYIPFFLGTETLHYVKNEYYFRMIPEQDLNIYIDEFGIDSIKDSIVYHEISKDDQKYLSKHLYEFSEPILYNYYLGKDIIRLTFLDSPNQPLMIKLVKDRDSIYLNYKLLNECFNSYSSTTVKNIDKSHDTKKHVKIESEANINITDSVFSEVELFIEETNIKDQCPSLDYITFTGEGDDFGNCLLEIHNGSGYYYNMRWSPIEESASRKIAQKLIKLSGLNKE